MSASQTFSRSRPPLKSIALARYICGAVSPLHPNYTPQRPKELGAWGKRNAGVTSRPTFRLPQLPRPQEISHTLKYDRLKLPTTFFTDKYGQVQIQTDIYEQQVYRADVRPDKLLFAGRIFLFFPLEENGLGWYIIWMTCYKKNTLR